MLKIGKSLKLISGLRSIAKNKRCLSSLSSPALLVNKCLKIGDNLHGYEVRRVEDIPELCLTAYHLYHANSGAEHLHIAREDNNNVFSVSLRTTPSDSTGVAHILEHLALCGSNKYPIRDPFMKMLQRSLATFMNAFTGPDYTMYPFSTQNNKDFYNLLSIYLDAVFFPRLRLMDFRQEGFRLEHSLIEDQSSPLVFKGVVFNEMKGVFSSPSTIYARALQNHIFPSNTYANESGGDPLAIPDLTHQQLKDFHLKHYHTSNARFYTYGNFPLESHLSFINDYVLSRFKANEEFKKSTYVKDQTKWSKAVKKSIECQRDPLAPFFDKQTTVSVTHMLESITNSHENFTLAILCSLLTDGPNAPLYQALIDSGLGSDYSPNSGYSNYTKQSLFSIGLQGIAKSEVNVVIDAIEKALKKASKEGFPNERIEAILHRVELSTKHQSSNFGLGLIMNVTPMWTHDANPIDGLKVNEHVQQFRNQLKLNPNYLKEKINQYLITNTHKLVLEMNPSDDYETLLQQKEEHLLNEKLSQLTDENKKEIYQNGIQLEKALKTPEDLSILPTLSVKNDISRQFKATNIESAQIFNVPIQWSAQPTNGITYFNAIMKAHFPKHLVPYLQLFSQVMTKLGAGKMDRKKLDQEIQLRTGGLQVSVHVCDHPSHFDQFEKGLIISSHCLERNIEHMFKLWTDLFNEIRFDDDYEHLQQLIRMCSSELSMNVPHYGHRYAMSRSASALGGAYKFRELTSGLSSIFHFRQMSSTDDIRHIVDNLKSIASILLKTDGLRLCINGEAPTIRPSLQIIERFVRSIDNNSTTDVNKANDGVIPVIKSTLSEHHVFPFSTNYLGKSVFCAPFTHDDFAKLKIASKLVSAKYLHREIRERGGAYGGGALLDNGGVFNYFSYRDPNITETIDAFKGSVDWLLDQNSYSEQDIDEAKLSIFQEVDHPIMPNEQGLEFFINRISDQMKHEYRMRLLEVTKTDIEEVAKRYLVDGTLHTGVVLIGPRSDITVSNPKWIVNEEKPKI